MTNKIKLSMFVIGVFVIGYTVTYLIPIQSATASIDKLYFSSQPPIFHSNDYVIGQCDWLGQNCQPNTPLSEGDKQTLFDAWCYSITNQYTYSVGKGSVTQYFRTMSHDCTTYIIDEELKPLNAKIDNLTKEIQELRNETK